MTDPKLRRAIWLLAQAILDNGYHSAADEAKKLASVEVHEFEGISGSVQGCTHMYINSTVCRQSEGRHPLGLEPDGKTK